MDLEALRRERLLRELVEKDRVRALMASRRL
jgi:hypothetical protein